MGNNPNKEKSTFSNDDEYWKMMKRRRERNTQMAVKGSSEKGKAYQELKIAQQKRQQAQEKSGGAASGTSGS